MTEEQFLQRAKELRRKEQVLVSAFVEAVQASSADQFIPALAALQHQGLWSRTARAVEGMDPSAEFRRRCLQSWIDSGDSIRDDVGNDLVLIRLLRVLLPRYDGPAVKVFRGESFHNRRRRTYGLSWTTDEGIARGFADGVWRTFKGGSVLVEADVPPGAVICAPCLIDDRLEEREYIVDRRWLGTVRVVERFAQESWEQHRKRCAELQPGGGGSS
jgi:hypothetical protein